MRFAPVDRSLVSKTAQLACGNFDLELVEQIAHLFHGNVVFLGDLLGHRARYPAVFGSFLKPECDLVLFQIALPPVLNQIMK
jgi:hypothetical protein